MYDLTVVKNVRLIMKKSHLVLLAIFWPLCLHAQQPGQAQIDSLERQIAAHPNDTTTVKNLIKLAELTYNERPELAEQHCQRANNLSFALQYHQGKVTALGWMAYLFERRGLVDSSLYCNNLAIDIAKKHGFKKDLAQCYNNVAAIYKDQGKIADALEYHNLSLAIKMNLNNKKEINASYNNIGLIYLNLGQIQEALNYFNKSLRLSEELQDKSGAATAFYNIATLYKEQKHYPEALEYLQRSLQINSDLKDKYSMAYDINYMGTIYEKQGLPDRAMDHYKQALQLRTALSDIQGMAYSLRNIGGLYELRDSAAQALTCYLQGLEYMQQADDKSGVTSLLNRLGNFYLNNGNTANAKKYAQQNMTLALDLSFPESIRDAAQLLNKIYRKERNWQQALEMNDLFIKMRDSVQNVETRESSLRDKFRYEFEKKELALQKEQEKKDAITDGKIKQQKILMNASLGGLLLVLLLLGTIYNRYRLKTKANIAISKEKQRSDELLLNILPEQVAEELKNTGTSEARMFEKVTVLFTDFVSFTQAGERFTPQQLVTELDICFKAFDRIIEKNRIEKIKTVGDAYIAVGGLPTEDPNHAENILNAAIEIRNFMNTRKSALQDGSFDIRIGIHSGSVVAGIVGVKKFSYDIWGDTVNTAARLEQHSAPGMINVSSATYELVQEKYTFQHRGKIEAKHKGEIDMYFLI